LKLFRLSNESLKFFPQNCFLKIRLKFVITIILNKRSILTIAHKKSSYFNLKKKSILTVEILLYRIIHTHTHTHTHARIRTHTHTHTHIYIKLKQEFVTLFYLYHI